MKCYKCKAELSSSDYCTSCGAEVKVYKKIIKSSEIYYGTDERTHERSR